MPRPSNYRGEASNSVAARKRIPTAEKAVNARRTLGLDNVVVALPIMLIKKEYHKADVNACTMERVKIPHPKLNSAGTNAGIKATAKTAALTLDKFVIKPKRSADINPIVTFPW